jgi:predicted DCC family thiol-disulfide oxidoreductase YuxK
MTPGASSPILFFDGECNLCNGLVQFVLKRDKKKIFFFSSLQSGAGKNATAAVLNTGSKKIDSVTLYYKGTYYTRSTPALLQHYASSCYWVGFGLYFLQARSFLAFYGMAYIISFPATGTNGLVNAILA